jgi:predicted lactoylglutathione lyase
MRPTARLTVITLGVDDVAASARFYEALGFTRKMKATGDQVAFFTTGASVLGLYAADKLAAESGAGGQADRRAFKDVTLAWNCSTTREVDDVLEHAAKVGGRIVKTAHDTHYGGYCGYFADPDGHIWEVVVAPGIDVQEDGRVDLRE